MTSAFLLFIGCPSEEAKTARAIEDWGVAWCAYLDRCCIVEDSPIGFCDFRPANGDEQICIDDWESAYVDCVIFDHDAFDACVECYETASLEDIGERSCISNVEAQCATICDNSLYCQETQ